MTDMKHVGVRTRQTDERGVRVRPEQGWFVVETVLLDGEEQYLVRQIGSFPSERRAYDYARSEVARTGYTLVQDSGR